MSLQTQVFVGEVSQRTRFHFLSSSEFENRLLELIESSFLSHVGSRPEFDSNFLLSKLASASLLNSYFKLLRYRAIAISFLLMRACSSVSSSGPLSQLIIQACISAGIVRIDRETQGRLALSMNKYVIVIFEVSVKVKALIRLTLQVSIQFYLSRCEFKSRRFLRHALFLCFSDLD